MKNKLLFSILFISTLFSCISKKEVDRSSLKAGNWRAEMDLQNSHMLPFNVKIEIKDSQTIATFINAEEEIKTEEIYFKNDSVFIKMPIFDSEFHLKIVKDSLLEGNWVNYYKSADYVIDVKFYYGQDDRFAESKPTEFNVAKKYEVTFSPFSEDEYKAIGLFEQNGDKVTGSFATETGDYRYLEGQIVGSTLFLSTFDGAHAFLFQAAIEDSILDGTFFSGTHFSEPFMAKINPTFELRNPDSLTYLKDDSASFTFEFENMEGQLVSLNDKKYQDKLIIVQIMGSWCPNCMDESLLFKQFYKDYKDQGLEIIALAFERAKTKENSMQNLKRMQEKLNLPYEILLAGATRDEKAEDKLPMINKIMSYPTAIVLNKNKEIIKIHTGFYGPGTGTYYEDYVKEMRALIEKEVKK